MTATLTKPGCDCENEALALSLADIRAHKCGEMLVSLEVTVPCEMRLCERLGHCPRLIDVDPAESVDDCDLKKAEFNGTGRLTREWR